LVVAEGKREMGLLEGKKKKRDGMREGERRE
jgi:hypothetical protein